MIATPCSCEPKPETRVDGSTLTATAMSQLDQRLAATCTVVRFWLRPPDGKPVQYGERPGCGARRELCGHCGLRAIVDGRCTFPANPKPETRA